MKIGISKIRVFCILKISPCCEGQWEIDSRQSFPDSLVYNLAILMDQKDKAPGQEKFPFFFSFSKISKRGPWCGILDVDSIEGIPMRRSERKREDHYCGPVWGNGRKKYFNEKRVTTAGKAGRPVGKLTKKERQRAAAARATLGRMQSLSALPKFRERIAMRRKSCEAIDYSKERLRDFVQSPVCLDPSTSSTPPQHGTRYVAIGANRKKAMEDSLASNGTLEVDEYGMNKRDYQYCREWLSDAAMPADGGKNATLRSFQSECLEKVFQLSGLPKKAVSSILKEKVGYVYNKVLNGYYLKKSILPDVIHHRQWYCELLQYFLSSEHYVVLFHDEAQLRIHQYPRGAWVDASDPLSKYDKRLKRTGSGYGISAFVYSADGGATNGLLQVAGTWVGHIFDSADAKDDHATFLDDLRMGLAAAKKQWPQKKIVVVADGSRTHKKCSAAHVRLCDVPLKTSERAVGLKDVLLELGLMERLEEQKTLRQEESGKKRVASHGLAKDLFVSSEYCWRQPCLAEELAAEYGAYLVIMPNSHPVLNPIERVWRHLKEGWRSGYFDQKNMAALFDWISGVLSNSGWSQHGEKLNVSLRGYFELSAKYLKFFHSIYRAALENPFEIPTESQLMSNKKWLKLQQERNVVDIETVPIRRLIGDPLSVTDIDDARLRNVTRFVNSGRQYDISQREVPKFESLGKFTTLQCLASFAAKNVKVKSEGGQEKKKQRDVRSKDDPGKRELKRRPRGSTKGKSKVTEMEAKSQTGDKAAELEMKAAGVVGPAMEPENAQGQRPLKKRRKKPAASKLIDNLEALAVPDTEINFLQRKSHVLGRVPAFDVSQKSIALVRVENEWVDDQGINSSCALLDSMLGEDTVILDSFALQFRTHSGFIFSIAKSGFFADDSPVTRLLLPAHVRNNHWCCVEVMLLLKEIRIYDSLPSKRYPCTGHIIDLLRRVLPHNGFGCAKDWKEVVVPSLNLQSDGSSCGIFTMARLRALALNWSEDRQQTSIKQPFVDAWRMIFAEELENETLSNQIPGEGP